MDYLSIKQLSEKWGISKEEFKLCVQQGESPELKKLATHGLYLTMQKSPLMPALSQENI